MIPVTKEPVSLLRGTFHVGAEFQNLVSLDVADHRVMEPTHTDDVDQMIIASPVLAMKPRIACAGRVVPTSKMDRAFECINQTGTGDSPPGLPTRRCSMEPEREATASPTSSMMFLDLDVSKQLSLILEDTEAARPPKRVRFTLDREGEVCGEVTIKSFTQHVLTEEDIADGWYSRTELRQMKADVPLECREYIQNIPEYYDAAVSVIGVAARTDFESVLHQNWESLQVLVDGEVRGLERPILFRLNLPRSPCKRVVAAVICTQATIRTLATEEDSDDDIAAVIAKQYMLNSKYAIRWAIILAAGDEKEAREYAAQ
jgi:hypothetical protein